MKTQNFPLDKHLLLQFRNGLQEQRRELLQTIEKPKQKYGTVQAQLLSTRSTFLVLQLQRNLCLHAPAEAAAACV